MTTASQAQDSNKLYSWFVASRFPSLLYILPPIVLGQVLALTEGGSFSEDLFILGLLYGVFLQLFVVFANDLADFEIDKYNDSPTIFSGGSRVPVRGLLSFRELLRGAFFVLAVCLLLAFGMSLLSKNFWVLALGLVGPVFLWAYSFPPFILSYRGGGELLQAVGLGCALPALGFLLQDGSHFSSLLYICLALLPSQLACAMSTAIPDAVSDEESQKYTFVVRLGPFLSCFGIFLLHTLSYGLTTFFLYQELIFSGVPHSFISLFLPQFLLALCLLYSFSRRQINFFVFFSLAHVFYLLAFFIELCL